MTTDTCRLCGCTEDHPCPTGCAWADETRTVCTLCVERVRAMPPELHVLIATAVTAGDQDEIQKLLLQALAADVLELHAEAKAMEMGLAPITAFQVCGLLQLALRHPGLSPELRLVGDRLVALFEQWFDAGAPAAAIAIRRGADPAHDRPLTVPTTEPFEPAVDEIEVKPPSLIVLPGGRG